MTLIAILTVTAGFRRRIPCSGRRALGVGVLWLALAITPAYATTQILVFGDSLSAAHGIARDEGWVALLRDRFAENGVSVRVVNASVSGETTAGGHSRLPAALDKHQPDIVVLELGGNDGLRALSTSAMKANLAAMIRASRAANARVLLLGIRIPANYGKTYSMRFHDVYEALARQFDVAYVPFFLEPVARDRSRFQNDGIHPNAGAQPLLLEHVWPAFLRLLDGAGSREALS